MAKIINERIERCSDCPYVDYDEIAGIQEFCSNPKLESPVPKPPFNMGLKEIPRKELHDVINFPKWFPEFCPLPNEEPPERK